MAKSKLSTRKSSRESGIASEFLVLSNLFRLGVDAFISLGNTKAIDIVIKAKNGSSISVDVKSVRDYSSIPINNVNPTNGHFVVVVIYKGKFSDPTVLPDFYIIPSVDVPGLGRAFGKEQRLFKTTIEKYKDKWDQLRV